MFPVIKRWVNTKNVNTGSETRCNLLQWLRRKGAAWWGGGENESSQMINSQVQACCIILEIYIYLYTHIDTHFALFYSDKSFRKKPWAKPQCKKMQTAEQLTYRKVEHEAHPCKKVYKIWSEVGNWRCLNTAPNKTSATSLKVGPGILLELPPLVPRLQRSAPLQRKWQLCWAGSMVYHRVQEKLKF